MPSKRQIRNVKTNRRPRRGNAAPRRRSDTVMLSRARTVISRAPAVQGATRTGGTSISFGPAPYHDNHGSGLRLTGRLLVSSVGRLSTATSNEIFPFSNGSSSLMDSSICSSLGHFGTGWHSMWQDVQGTYTFFANLMRTFSRFAIRRMVLHYLPAVSTATSGTLALACVKQDWSQVAEESTFRDISSLPCSVSTPYWKPASLLAVADNLRTPASQLYDTIDASVTEEVRTGLIQSQFIVIGALSSQLASGNDSIGYIEVEVVIDLYGQRSVQTPLPPTAKRLARSTEMSAISMCSSSCCSSSSCDSKEAKDDRSTTNVVAARPSLTTPVFQLGGQSRRS